MNWPEKTAPTTDASEKRTLGKGVFRLCAGCGETMPAEELVNNFEVCPLCEHHHRLEARRWPELICDGGALDAWDTDLRPTDPLEFSDDKPYVQRIATSQKKTGSNDAIDIGQATVDGRRVAFGKRPEGSPR